LKPAAPTLSVQTPPRAFGAAFAALLFLAVFFPDEKLSRPKLLFLELGFFLIPWAWLLLAAWQGRLELRPSAGLWGVAAWAVFAALSLAFGDHPALAAAELRRTLLALAAFVAASQVLDERGRGTAMRGWAAGAVVVAVYGLLQRSGGIGPLQVPPMERVMGTFGNPIFFGAYLVYSVPFLTKFAKESRGLTRAAWSAGTAAALAALYFTGTRAAWLGLAAGAAVLMVRAASNPGGRTFPERRRIFFIGFILVGGFFVWSTKDVWRRDQAHLLIWRDTAKLWLRNPLLGAGAGEFHIHFPAAAGEDLKAKWPQDKFIVNYAHNEYLQLLAETGAAGLLLFLLPFWAFYRSRPGGAPLAAVTGGLTQALFSVDLRFSVSTAFLFFLAGGAAPRAARTWTWRPSALRRAAGSALLLAAAGLALPRLLHPYLAQRRSAQAADFFDERLLDPAKTIAELEELSRLHPDQPAVFEKLGYAWAKEIRRRGADGKAVVDAEAADKAVAAYEAAVRLDPARAGAYNNLANIHFTLGDRPRALENWARSLQAAPDQLDARLNLGKVYYLEGRLKEAAEQFRRVLELQPANDEATVYLKKMVE
jgi:tetratricopeptide (TPR) repeat protein